MKPYPTNWNALRRDVSIKTSRSPGPGGQRRDKKETAVRLVHRPTGITVVASERRSQAANMQVAFQRLRAKLAELNKPTKLRLRTKPTAHSIQGRLEGKKRLSEKKRSRRRPEVPADDGTG